MFGIVERPGGGIVEPPTGVRRRLTKVPGTIQSVTRAVALLRVLATHDEPMAVTQLARSLGLAKGTTHGLLRTLVDVGFVDWDQASSHYTLGRALLELGSTRLDLNELRSRALNWTDALAARTGQAVLLVALRGAEGVVAHHVFKPDGDGQASLTGVRLPLHATAHGKVLLAFDPRGAHRLTGRTIESLTYQTITDRSQLLRALADVRDLGSAAAVEEAEPGVATIAAPVRDRDGYVVAAVGIQGRVQDICDARTRPRPPLTQHVVEAARLISRELGHGRAA